MNERYKTEHDFRRALEARLAAAGARGGRGLVRERQVFIFERFLARAQATDMDVVVKGGMALELRTQRARSTRDIDLRAMGASESFERALLALAASTGEDLLTFQVHNHGKPDIDAPGMKYGGRRYRVQAHLAGKLYGDPFGVDVAYGEPIFGAPDRVRGRTDLSFIGMEAPELTVYPRLTHIAEKLHAYTVPRPSPNSRVRDIPDLALLAGLEGAIDATDLRSALGQTFEHRATHALPERVPSVPARWAAPYAAMAEANLLPWKTLAEVERAVAGFLDPALAGVAGSWRADRWAWSDAG